MSSRLMFDTYRFPPRQRRNAWSGHIRDVLFDAEIQSFDHGMDATVAGYQFDELSAFTFMVNGHSLQRTSELIEKSPKDSVFVSLVLDGQITYFRPDQSVVLRAGDALVYPASTPYFLASQTGTRQLFLDIPVTVARSEFGLQDSEHPVVFSLAERSSLSLTELVDLSRAVEDGAATTTSIESRLLTVARASLNGQSADSGVPMSQVRAVVKAMSNDADADSGAIAAQLGYSVRHINRGLQRVGTSLAQLLLTDRVDTATRLLRTTSLTTMVVAAHSGFGSVSTMQRALRSEGFGSPTQIRAGAFA